MAGMKMMIVDDDDNNEDKDCDDVFVAYVTEDPMIGDRR